MARTITRTDLDPTRPRRTRSDRKRDRRKLERELAQLLPDWLS